ncbi:MAG: hypothetical protein ACK5PU_03700, partial [bacterium]
MEMESSAISAITPRLEVISKESILGSLVQREMARHSEIALKPAFLDIHHPGDARWRALKAPYPKPEPACTPRP